MSDLSVSLSNYSFGQGMDDSSINQANVSQEQLANLTKAMEAGHLQGGELNNPAQTNAGALKVESLEKTLKLITFKESDIRFWKRFPKSAAFNTVEEFNQLTSYGQDRGGFNNEGELPEEEDSQYTRKAELVKFLGVTKSVTHPAQLVQTNIGSIMQKEVTNGIMWILRKANKALFHGDSATISQEWNGLYAQHLNNDEFTTLNDYYNSDLVIDLRGKTLREINIEDGCRTLLNRFAQADLLVAPPIVLSDFSANFYANKRVNVGQAGAVQDATMGQSVRRFNAQTGMIDFEYDIFAAKSPGKKTGGVAGSPKAPAAPVADGVAPTAIVAAQADSEFGDGIGTYFYAVSAVNRYGESPLTSMGALATVTAATDVVDVKFAAGAGTYAPTAYVVYRSKVNPVGAITENILYPIATVPVTGNTLRGSLLNGVDGGAAGIVRDKNRVLPATEEAMLLQGDTDVIEFKQLAPLMKMPLARLSPADRFMILLYGTPLLYAPTKMVKYINIGRDLS